MLLRIHITRSGGALPAGSPDATPERSGDPAFPITGKPKIEIYNTNTKTRPPVKTLIAEHVQKNRHYATRLDGSSNKYQNKQRYDVGKDKLDGS